MSLPIRHSRLLLLLALAALLVRKVDAERLLTAAEGSAIAHEATSYEGAHRFTDCSHLVHRIFTSLGLDYGYATSNQLYRGTGDFERVHRPQAGDLIVWRGHVGVVVDPVERTFFSAVTAGMRTHNYDSPYWARRGTARFYRYVLASAAPPQLIAAASNSRSARKQTASRNRKSSPIASTDLPRKLTSAALRIAGRRNRTSRAAAAAATILFRR
jgi:hypothetical protein